MSTLDKVYLQIIGALDKSKSTYMIIGGLAVGILGEARMTQDIDIIISISEERVSELLKEVKRRGFTFSSKKIFEDIRSRGVFRIDYAPFHVDFIIGSMPFEMSAFARRKKIKLFGKSTYFPTPEDLILFKLIAGREKDILDARTIIERHGKKINEVYLKKWAMVISDDLEDARVYDRLKKLL